LPGPTNKSRASRFLESLVAFSVLVTLLASSAAGSTERVLYNFQGGADGSTPAGRLVFDKDGDIYGVTTNGGSSSCITLFECGTVFQLLRPKQPGGAWTERVLYVFKGNAAGDGASPFGGLVMDGAGNLYGTTGYGGTGNCMILGTREGCGTVFELSPPSEPRGQWTERVIYNFRGWGDGQLPWGDLVFDEAGNLYGATEYGGGYGSCNAPYYHHCGTVFKLSRPQSKSGQWKETVLYGFKGGTDGANPNGGLVFGKKMVLYGTTQVGGFNCSNHQGQGCGTVFSLTPQSQSGGTWTETVLYSFKGPFETPQDGNTPYAGVTQDDSANIFGTTWGGGEGASTWGTVYELVRSGNGWSEQLLHSFGFTIDGGNPESRLIFDARGDIYGTGLAGGIGGGTIFRLKPGERGWTLDTLYEFGNYSGDGFFPVSMRFAPEGGLYGTTEDGGNVASCGNNGCGTVFVFEPSGLGSIN
jgi:hypothetical protein